MRAISLTGQLAKRDPEREEVSSLVQFSLLSPRQPASPHSFKSSNNHQPLCGGGFPKPVPTEPTRWLLGVDLENWGRMKNSDEKFQKQELNSWGLQRKRQQRNP